MSFSWFPGHMAKGLRQIGEDLKLVDLVLLVVDARIPRSSRHVQIETMLRSRGKGYCMVLNKTDLAEPVATAAWVDLLRKEGVAVVSASALMGRGIEPIKKVVADVRGRVLERARKKGRLDAPVRLLVAGIPNVGKSSLINRLTADAGGSRGRTAPARTGRHPGVTRSRQWIALPGGLELRDTPGILFPRIASREMFLHLAATGAIKEDNLPLDEVGEGLAELLRRRGALAVSPRDGQSMLEAVAASRGMLLSGGVVDVERAAHFLLKHTREGRWGPMTLERVDDVQPEDTPTTQDDDEVDEDAL